MRTERIRALVISAIVMAAVLIPVLRPVGDDSFPLSRYPMYASNRSRQVVLTTAVGEIDGHAQRLSSMVIANTRDPLIAVGRLRRAVRAGDRQLGELCAAIAGRSDLRSGTTIDIRTERHDAVARLGGEDSLLSITSHHRCTVG